jgi:hypothetical protein
MTRRLLTAIGATALAAAFPAAAAADEINTGPSIVFPSVTLVAVDEVDDPAEDVLEHATILGETHMGAEPPEPAPHGAAEAP